MANAKKNVETVETFKGVTLDLSPEEAIYLRDVLGSTQVFGIQHGVNLFNTLNKALPEAQHPRMYRYVGVTLKVERV